MKEIHNVEEDDSLQDENDCVVAASGAATATTTRRIGMSPLEVDNDDATTNSNDRNGNGNDDTGRDGLMLTSTSLTLKSSDINNIALSSSLEDAQQAAHSDFYETLAGVAGNVLEWYDFAIFGYLGDVIGQVFFPPDQAGDWATIESFAVFGGAFLMRPVGGVFFGYIGDKFGRKRALTLSIFFMAFPTFAMGCLPSYSQVGATAIVLLVIVRLLQGLSVGGQLMSSLVFTLENHPRSKWGLYGSYVMASANFGTLLGGIVGFILRNSLNPTQVVSWGWRIPFLSGILVSVCGFYLRSDHHHDHDDKDKVQGGDRLKRRRPRRRRKCGQHAHAAVPTAEEIGETSTQSATATAPASSENTDDNEATCCSSNKTSGDADAAAGIGLYGISDDDGDNNNDGNVDDYDEEEEDDDELVVQPPAPKKNPVLVAFSKENRQSLCAASLVPMLWSGGFYLCFVWMAIYQAELIEDPVPHPFGVNSGALLISVCLFFPFAGILSDRFSRRTIMTIGGLSMMVLSPILIMLIGRGNALLALISQSVLGIALSLWGAPMCAWLVESFEPEARLTSVAIGYNIAQCVVGGSAPSVATLMVDEIGPASPGWYLSIVAVVALSGLWFVAPKASTANAATVSASMPLPQDDDNNNNKLGDVGGMRQLDEEDEML